MTNQNQSEIFLNLRQLIARLERLSADSAWAHRASGLRGGLLRVLQNLEDGKALPADFDRLQSAAFSLLVKAAQEISVPPHENR